MKTPSELQPEDGFIKKAETCRWYDLLIILYTIKNVLDWKIIYISLFQPLIAGVLLKYKKPTRCHLLYLLYFLETQHVSGINMSIFRSLRKSRKLLKMYILMRETCWVFKK